MECNLGWNHTRDFKIERARSVSSIWNHAYDFSPKLHDTRFNYLSITPILKSPKYRLGQLNYFIDAVPSRFEIKFIHVIEGNLPHDTFCLSFAWNLIGYFKQALKSDFFLFLVQPSHWLGKRCDLKQLMVRFVNKLHQLEPIRLQGPPVISKWV